MTEKTRTEIDAAVEAAHSLLKPRTVDVGEDPGLIAHGARVQLTDLGPHIDKYRAHPRRKKGNSVHHTLASFIAHVRRNATAEHAAVFVTDTAFQAVYDYHAGHEGPAGWGEHRAHYPLPLSDEFLAWRVTRSLSGEEFAEFIEDHLADVLEAEDVGEGILDFARRTRLKFAGPVSLLNLSRGVSINVDAKVKEHRKLSSGEAQVVFETTHRDEAGAVLDLPGAFAVGIPVFKGGGRYALAVRLRYKVRGGAITWEFVPHGPDRLLDHARGEAVEMLEAEIEGVPVFAGLPE